MKFNQIDNLASSWCQFTEVQESGYITITPIQRTQLPDLIHELTVLMAESDNQYAQQYFGDTK